MKHFQSQILDLNGNAVRVDTYDLETDGIPAFKAVAVIGQTTIEETHTLGPVNGGHGPLHPDHVKNALIETRVRAARAAVLHESLRLQYERAKAA